MPKYACYKHRLHWFAAPFLIEDSCKISASLLKDILRKGRKIEKEHKLCISMLINPSWYISFEKIIVDLQITIDRVHPVQILSCSHYCITTHILWKTPKMPKKNESQE